ncbi:MAG: hypothetical protein PWP01_919 [Methanosarcinales archaeon]|nr:hypothetical protein [Methanosarcinales archaeon]
MRMKWTAAFVALVIAGALMGVGCIQNEEGTRAAESAVYVKVLPPATMLDALKSGDVDAIRTKGCSQHWCGHT